MITVGWRTVWTRFSDYRFSKKVQLSRHRGPHRTKKKFSHAISLCLPVRVRKVHCTCNTRVARVQSCSHALLRLVDEQLRQRAAVHASATSWWGHARPSPCPGRFAKAWRARLWWIVDLPGFEQWQSQTPALDPNFKKVFSFFVENVRFVIFHPKLVQPPPPVSKCVTFRKKLRTYEMLPKQNFFVSCVSCGCACMMCVCLCACAWLTGWCFLANSYSKTISIFVSLLQLAWTVRRSP